MGDMEKINIYVPETVGNVLQSDVTLFEVFKKDGSTVNRNRFLNLLISGYHRDYIRDCWKIREAIKGEIEKSAVPASQRVWLVENILQKAFLPEVPSRKGKRPVSLSLKPTKETEGIIKRICADLAENDYISQYLCRMFMAYCRKPLYEREQVIFKSQYDFLTAVCEKKSPITFSTIWSPARIQEVVPYALVTGREEMLNYLLCQQLNCKTGKAEARAYRLNRMTNLSHSKKAAALSETVREYLDAMKKHAPQYAINGPEEICVKLSELGIKSYHRIYYGRPVYERAEKRPDGVYYYFLCSEDQLYLYFRKFNPNESEILYPESLREKIIAFHRDSLIPYTEGKGELNQNDESNNL